MSDRKKLLLHICCAPDATYVISALRDYNLTGYFYNPNIYPEEEYILRLREMEGLAEKLGISLHPSSYDPERWFELTKGLEYEPERGRRCEICFRMRLESTARLAEEEGFDIFTTTLTISPHKDAELINKIGREIAANLRVEFMEADFKKKDGFKKSVELSKKYGLYRQDYCGCIYSKRDREKAKRGHLKIK